MAEAVPEITPAKSIAKRKMPRIIPNAINFPFTGESATLSKFVNASCAVFDVVRPNVT